MHNRRKGRDENGLEEAVRRAAKHSVAVLAVALIACGESSLELQLGGDSTTADQQSVSAAGQPATAPWPYRPSFDPRVKKLFENKADCAADLANAANAAAITTMAHLKCCAAPSRIDFVKGPGPLTDKIKCGANEATVTCDGPACKAAECVGDAGVADAGVPTGKEPQ
jgi:hypothetical protein